MFKLSELAPDLARRIADDEAHRQECTEPVCAICDRREFRAAETKARNIYDSIERNRNMERLLDEIPTEYDDAKLDAAWLAELVGVTDIERALSALGDARVVFIGPPGSGKSSLVSAMYRAAAEAETSFRALGRYRWMSAHQLAKARAIHPLGEGEAPAVEAAICAPLLVLDELGGEDPRHSSAVAEVLYERHAERRKTWITTGVGSKEIAARYGGGIARRVFEHATVFKLKGKR